MPTKGISLFFGKITFAAPNSSDESGGTCCTPAPLSQIDSAANSLQFWFCFFYSCQIFANTVNCAFFLLSLRKPKKKTMRLPKPRPKNNNQKRKPTSLSKSKSLQPVRNGIEGKLGAEIGLFDSRWVLGLLGGPACLGLEQEKLVQGGDCRVPSGSSFPPRFSDGCSGPSLASRRCGISTTTLFRKRILSRRLAWFVFDSFSSTVAINEFSVPTSVACFGNYPSWIAILILIA